MAKNISSSSGETVTKVIQSVISDGWIYRLTYETEDEMIVKTIRVYKGKAQLTNVERVTQK